MKKNLLCTALAFCTVLSASAFPLYSASAAGETAVMSSTHSPSELPNQKTLPLAVLQPAEDSKSAKIARSTFDFTDTVSVRRYIGADATATIAENNVYNLSYSAAGLYTDTYRYCEVVYYYDTASRTAEQKRFGMTLGCTWDTDTGKQTPWSNAILYADETLKVGEWTSVVFDLSEFETLSPASFGSNTVYDHIRFRPFGDLRANALAEDDVVYIKSVTFLKENPRAEKLSYTVRYYESASKAALGGDDYLYTDTWTVGTHENVRGYVNAAGKSVNRWCDVSDNTVYRAGESVYVEIDGDLNLCPVEENELVFYVRTDGNMTGVDATLVHTSLQTALYALGDRDGTIYISGDVTFPSAMDACSSPVTIRGYNGTSDRLIMSSGGSTIRRDVTFESITLKAQPSDERWIEACAHVTIAESCVVERSEPYTSTSGTTLTYGLYFGRNDEYVTDGKITLSSPTGQYAMIAPIGQYSAGGGYSVTGNFECILNDGTVSTLNGGVRNGCGTAIRYQTVDGDVTYRINGGKYGNIVTGSTLGGHINGNVLIFVDGGAYTTSSKLIFGNTSNGYAASSSYNNIAVLMDGKNLSEKASGSSALTVASQADFASVSKNSAVLILNHAEYTEALPTVTATALTGKYRVHNGTARPVYADEKFGGKLLGYEITGDTAGFSPRIGSTWLKRNEHGVYTLPAGDTFYDITFGNALAGQFFTVYFDYNNGSDEKMSVSAEGNVAFTLPPCTATYDGYCFGGWEKDGVTYRVGESVSVGKESTFRALWLRESDASAVYVSSEYGSDEAKGISGGAPVATLETALARAAELGVNRIVFTDLVSSGLSSLSFNGSLIFTANDGTTQYDGGFVNLSPLNIQSPVTFENMAVGSKANSFVNTMSTAVVFGKNLTRAVGTNGVYAHFGTEYAASRRVDVTAESWPFRSAYLGGAYRKTASVGVTGDVFFTVGCTVPNLTIGFDGYTNNDAIGSIAGSVVLKLNKGASIENITTLRLSSIGGAVYVLARDGAVLPDASVLPESAVGSYVFRIKDGGTVTPSYDADGNVTAGMIYAEGAGQNTMVRIIDENGTEAVYPDGDIALSPGRYTVEFLESETITEPSFTVKNPYIGQPTAGEHFTSSAYTAETAWQADGKTTDYFKADTDYTLTLTLYPRRYADTAGFTSVRINGKSSAVTDNGDGSFTATVLFPKNTGTLNKSYVRYVSADGDDGGAGTESAPYKTLGKAVSTLSSVGGTIYIRGRVNAGVTYNNRKPLYITGYGDESAELYLTQYNGILLSAETTFDNLLFSMGESSHINGRGSPVIFGDNLTLDGKMLHAGAYNTGKSMRSVDSSYTYIGGSSVISTLHAGGGYITAPSDGVSGDITVVIGKNATVRSMAVGADHYLDTHTGVSLDGSLLVTVNGGTLKSVSASTCPVYPSETTTYQFIFNDGAVAPAIAERAAPLNRRYCVLSAVGGRVEHALDENGRAIPGQFDVNPNPDHYALIQYGTYSVFTRGGRFTFPSGTDVKVSYVRSSYPLSSFTMQLNGGTAEYDMVSIDADGNVHFGAAPRKEGYAFEGWYADAGFTTLIKEGDFVGSNCVLYAKYRIFSVNENEHNFNVLKTRVRMPQTEGALPDLRYIMEINLTELADILAFSEKNAVYNTDNSVVGYGGTVLPTEKLSGRELLCDTDYAYRGNSYRSKSELALNLYGREGDIQRYTLCVTDITTDKYEYGYTVRPFLRYYTRSGNLATIYGKAYSDTMYKAAVDTLESGEETEENEDYLRARVCQVIADKNGIEFIPREVLEEVNTKTEQYKQNVLNSQNPSTSGYTAVYYVSADGNDNNSGTSPSSPWKTVSKVNGASLASGSAVLFRRGDMFRGKLTAKTGVTYSAYGSGAKPIINGSARNYADPSLWSETALPNVYKFNGTLANVGVIAFDHTGEIGKYDETVGEMRVSGVTYYGKAFYNQNQLDGDLQFYSNLSTNELFVYSTKGNPGSRFTSIEIGDQGNLFSPASHVTVDNLHFLYGGSHGVGAGGGYAKYDANGHYIGITGTSDLTVTNCIFAWIGGSILKGFDDADTTRYGNAVEIFGSVDGYRVENNWIYQIYDTAITHQMSSSSCGDSIMQDILYRKNLCEYCHWSIEFYNAPCKYNHSRIVRDVLVEENIIRMGGFGWGSIFRRTGATLYNSFGLSDVPEETQNFLAKNNIFFRSKGPIYRLNSNRSERNLTFDGNLYIQDYGGYLAYYCGSNYMYGIDAESRITAGNDDTIIGETNCGGVYYYLP